MRVDWKCEGHFLFENATNISEHGIFVEINKPLPPGTLLNLEFSLPDSKEKIKAMGEVIWVNSLKGDSNPGMGVRFVNLNDIDRETILTLIKKIAVLHTPA